MFRLDLKILKITTNLFIRIHCSSPFRRGRRGEDRFILHIATRRFIYYYAKKQITKKGRRNGVQFPLNLSPYIT